MVLEDDLYIGPFGNQAHIGVAEERIENSSIPSYARIAVFLFLLPEGGVKLRDSQACEVWGRLLCILISFDGALWVEVGN